jgi:hypothetical protein
MGLPLFQKSVGVADNWGGRFWARTGCNFNQNGQGHCATGDCGDKLQCRGAGGVPPATLAEVTLKGDRGQDFYDVSLVDGFNVPVQVRNKLRTSRFEVITEISAKIAVFWDMTPCSLIYKVATFRRN